MGRAVVLVGVLVTLVALSGCADDGATRPPSAGAPATSTSVGPVEEDPLVDATLAAHTIAIRGAPRVGTVVRIVVSSDLADVDIAWGWHRCALPAPSCLTVPGADAPAYALTENDAWQAFRVIGVVGDTAGRADVVEARFGPVVDTSPQPFTESLDLGSAGARAIVAPGTATLVVDAGCPVRVAATVRTLDADADATVTGEVTSDPATHHELEIAGGGGLLTVATDGNCAATLSVSARR